MKRGTIIVLAALLLAGCALDTEPLDGRVVVNSEWYQVPVPRAGARALDSGDSLVDYVAEYNETHLDDQLFIFETEGDVPPVEEAPDCTVYIVQDSNRRINYEGTWPRADVIARRPLWELSAEVMADPDTGMLVPHTLYIDRIPEPLDAALCAPEDPWVQYAIYVVYNPDGVEDVGDILYEEHATAATYAMRLTAWGYTVELHNLVDDPAHPWERINGRLYPAVVEPEPEL